MTSPRRSSAEGAGAPRALRRLGPENLECWQRLGTAVRQLLSPSEFRRCLPDDVAAWTRAEQRAWLEAALALPPRAPRTALTVYRQAPPALGALPRALRA